MTPYEHQEIAIVIEPDTVVNPNAVMIEFFNANIAHTAMFGSSRLNKLASLAFIVFKVN
jgi:hypothetical protein